MKRLIFLSIVAVLTVCNGHSQDIKNVHIKDYTLALKEDGHLYFDMELDLSQLDVKTTQVVVLNPFVIHGTDTVRLKSIGVYGRNRKVYYQRNEEEMPTEVSDINLSPSETSEVIGYNASVPFVDWMNGCKVELVRTDYGCCGYSALVDRAELVGRFPLESYVPQLLYHKPEREVVKIRAISGSAFIDFPVSRTVINPTYRNNTVELAKITGTIDSVKNDRDITIKSIFIKGFASPESPYSNNTRLAKGRTEALKKYVENLYHFDEDFIKTDFEPEDWAGLEKYVMQSSLPHKEEILEAIRSDREPDNKEWFIKSNWRDDYRYLLENCYPALRHSDYVIEYEIRSYSNPAEIEQILHTAPQNLSLEEFYLLAQTYESGSEEFNDLFETAVRKYPDDPVANLNAANSAILKKDYRRALRYLEKAEGLPEAAYARGALEVYMENNAAAKPYFQQAKSLGIPQAEKALMEIAKDRNIFRMNKNNK